MPWTKEEDKYLIDNWHKKNAEIAEVLGRSYHSVNARRRTLRLKGFEPEKIETLQTCPNCKSTRNNKADTTSNTRNANVTEAYYCLNCLHEFKNGKIITPLF